MDVRERLYLDRANEIVWHLLEDGAPLRDASFARAVLDLTPERGGTAVSLDSAVVGWGAGAAFEWDATASTLTLRLGAQEVEPGFYVAAFTLYDGVNPLGTRWAGSQRITVTVT